MEAQRNSEWDSEKNEFKIHPARTAIPCDGPLNTELKEKFRSIVDELKHELDAYLEGEGKSSCEGMSRKELVKKQVPYKWIVTQEGEIMLGKSMLPPANSDSKKLEKVGHVSLIGGAAPLGRMAVCCIARKMRRAHMSWCLTMIPADLANTRTARWSSFRMWRIV